MAAEEKGYEPPYGWVMVAVAGTYMGIGSGVLNSMSVFLVPVSTSMGWLRGQTAFAYLAATMAMGVGGILTGYLSDRFSTRPVVLAGAVGLGLWLLLLAGQSELWQFYLLYFLLGGLGFSAFTAPMQSNVGSWFSRNRGTAIGLVNVGRSMGGAVVPFFAGSVIAASGWRTAYATLGIATLVVLVPLALLVRRPPAVAAARQAAASANGAAAGGAGAGRAAVSDVVGRLGTGRSVLWIGVCGLFCCLCMAVPLVHVVALARDRGIAAQSAAGIITVIMVAGVFGSVTFGRLADRFGQVKTYWFASAWQTASVFWFTQVDTLAGFFVIALLFGWGFSGVMTCLITCIQGMTPVARRGISTGIVTLFAWAGMGTGGFLGGLFFDLTGDYTLSFAFATAAGLANLVAVGSLFLYAERPAGRLAAQMAAGQVVAAQGH
ncbi:MAG: MFS transporter [bacterium]